MINATSMYLRRGLSALLVLCFGALLWGCNSDSIGTTSSPSTLGSEQSAPYAAEASTGPEVPATHLVSQAGPEEYRIAPRDILQVTVFQVNDLTRAVQVDSAGAITLPLLKSVKVGGMTVREAQDMLTDRLKKTYLQSPEVSVALLKSGQKVTMNGAVKSPQVLTVEGQLTLSQAVAQSGGLSELADASRVHVARLAPGSDHVTDLVYNMTDIQAGRAPDPRLTGGDIVVAESSDMKVALKNVKDLLPFAAISTLAMSDASVKRNIAFLERLPNGLALHRFQYLWSDTIFVGVIAQEVQKVVPSAVARGRDGILRVAYGQLGISMKTCKAWMASRSASERGISCL